MARAVRIKDHWAEQRLFLTRLVVAGVFVTILTAVVLTRLVQLQLVQYDYYSAQSQGNRIRIQPVAPTRGLILDRNGKVLAENQATFDLELTAEQVPDLADTLQRLADIGLLSAEQLADAKQEIAAHRRFDAIGIRSHLSDEEVARFAVRRPYFPGVEIRARLSRRYPYGQALAHALGYVGGISAADLQEIDQLAYAGTASIGKVSVERAFEDELHGVVGQEQVLVNARGRSLQTLDRSGARPGADVMLAIDLDAQLAAYAALEGKRGAAVAVDPNTGEVLVFVSTPAYDPNVISAGLSRKAYNALQEDIDKPLFNRALRGAYPPGSTIKPIIALAALAAGTVTPSRRVWCGGAYSLPGSSHRYRDWKPEGHGSVDLQTGLEQSCDVYFYSVARELGIQRMSDFLKGFGLGEVTGLDMPGEKGGLVPSPEWKRKAFRNPANQVWFPGETVITGIGQGYLLVTPLQLAHAAAAIAVRGQRYQPTMLHATRDPITGAVKPVQPEALPGVTVPDPAYWNAVIEGMHGVMHGARGTARAVGLNAPFQMAGKSGTAQVFTVAQTQKYKAAEVAERMRDHALFVAFAPLEQPRIAVAVIIENGESGSKAAAPIARKVMEAYLRLPAAGMNNARDSSRNSRLGRLARVLRWAHMDPPMLAGILGILTFATLVLYSASGQSLALMQGHAGKVAVALAAMLVAARVDPVWLRRGAPWLYVAGLALLGLVLVSGDIAKGGQRWLDFGIRFQPSEIMKLAVPMTLARVLHDRPLPPSLLLIASCLVIVLVPTGLIAVQPDLGTAVLIVLTGATAIFLAGLGWRYIIGATTLAVAAMPALWMFMRDYQRKRVLTLLDPDSDPLGAGYHIIQSKIAIGSGGFFGKGWLNGSQGQLEFLPERSTDFIFAVIGEEWGLMGVLTLFTLYLFVVGRGLYIALTAPDTFTRLLAGSLSITFFFYVFVNSAMVTGLLPVVGVPLPLVSAGGTSMVTLLAGFGILMSIQTHRKLGDAVRR